jgi:hypothetical protein
MHLHAIASPPPKTCAMFYRPHPVCADRKMKNKHQRLTGAEFLREIFDCGTERVGDGQVKPQRSHSRKVPQANWDKTRTSWDTFWVPHVPYQVLRPSTWFQASPGCPHLYRIFTMSRRSRTKADAPRDFEPGSSLSLGFGAWTFDRLRLPTQTASRPPTRSESTFASKRHHTACARSGWSVIRVSRSAATLNPQLSNLNLPPSLPHLYRFGTPLRVPSPSGRRSGTNQYALPNFYLIFIDFRGFMPVILNSELSTLHLK